MSYDLKLFAAPPGSDVHALFAELETDEGDPDEPAMRRLAEKLKSGWRAFVQSESRAPLKWIELDDETLQVQVSIQPRSVDIHARYFRADASAMMRCVVQAIQIIQAETGYVAFDPQSGLVSRGDLQGMVAQYRSVKPWWKFW